MKKRLTGLLALILTLVITSSPTVFAADPMGVYLRAAETPLANGTKDIGAEEAAKTENFGTPLLEAVL